MERLQKDLISEKENLCVKSVQNVLLEAQCSKMCKNLQKFREIFFHKKIQKTFKIFFFKPSQKKKHILKTLI